ncbi:MAG: hypothetical protein WC100_03510 [Sterolibacterium sp.]
MNRLKFPPQELVEKWIVRLQCSVKELREDKSKCLSSAKGVIINDPISVISDPWMIQIRLYHEAFKMVVCHNFDLMDLERLQGQIVDTMVASLVRAMLDNMTKLFLNTTTDALDVSTQL